MMVKYWGTNSKTRRTMENGWTLTIVEAMGSYLAKTWQVCRLLKLNI